MNRGLVNLKELRQNIDKADFCGTTAYCFVKDDKIIKVYARNGDKDFFPLNDDRKICDLSQFVADTIIFPQSYIYEKGRIVGEILKYVKDKSIDKSFNDVANIKSIIDNYELLRNDIQLYSNIDMVDLCFVNILYSNSNGFHLIDTTEWIITDNALKNNIERLDSSLIDVMNDYLEIPITYSKYYNKIDQVFVKNVSKYGNAGKRLQNNMDLLMKRKYNFLNMMFAYIDMYRIYCGKDVETLKDIKEFTKVLKKG